MMEPSGIPFLEGQGLGPVKISRRHFLQIALAGGVFAGLTQAAPAFARGTSAADQRYFRGRADGLRIKGAGHLMKARC
jgi:hypothetical protein